MKLFFTLLLAFQAAAQDGSSVLVIVNKQSLISRRIGQYYAQVRQVPPPNVCQIDTAEREEIQRNVYSNEIESSIAKCLNKNNFHEHILYIATTMGVPLRVAGHGDGLQSDQSSVDSELALLYARMKGAAIGIAGSVNNPFFGHRDAAFRHPNFPIYLVTRLAGYDFADVKGLIDRALVAKDAGKWVVDVRADNNTDGNNWLRDTAALLPSGRLILDNTAKVLYDLKGIIGYASWGSNDGDRHRRTLGFQWLPGAIATEFVSTSGRTFARPPQSWTLGNWKDTKTWFEGSPQDLSADFVHEGVTGVSGQVYEPYLANCPRPNYILPAYASGRNLAESFYLGLPVLSWQNIVIGDPLCKLRQ